MTDDRIPPADQGDAAAPTASVRPTPASPPTASADAASTAAAPSVAEAIGAAAKRSGLGALSEEGQPNGAALLGAMGGVRGILEAVVPGLLFVIVYSLLTATKSDAQTALVWALAVSVGVAVVFTIVRVIGRTPVTQAIGGLVGVVASAALSLWTGRGEDNFVLGLLLNLGYAVALLISVLVRWPIIGVAVGYLMGDGSAWRADKRKYRVMLVLTLCWTALFVARLAVQAPLYFAGNVEWLGATKLIMGLPLYAPLLVLTWITARNLYRKA